MEAIAVGVAILIVLVLIDAAYCLAISLVHSAPVLIIGAVAVALALGRGIDPVVALAFGALASLVAKHIRRGFEDTHEWRD